jgi:hypothetical protein
MPDRLDPAFVRAQIEALRVSHPDIWEDETDRLLALESETTTREYLIAVVRRMLEAEALADELEATKARQQRFGRRAEAMRALAHKVMDWAELRKLELPQATLSIRAGVPRVIVTDETVLPPNCVRIKREPDKTAIREHLARGERIPGAEMSNAEPVLAVLRDKRIK